MFRLLFGALSFEESRIYDKDALFYDAEKIYHKVHKLVAEVEFRTRTLGPHTLRKGLRRIAVRTQKG